MYRYVEAITSGDIDKRYYISKENQKLDTCDRQYVYVYDFSKDNVFFLKNFSRQIFIVAPLVN